jgi:HlyD family secretion protein
MKRTTSNLLRTAAFGLGVSALLGTQIQSANAQGTALQPVAPAVAKAPSIMVVAAEKREIVETAVVSGSLVAREEVVVGVDIEGLKVIELTADIGDKVKAGQIIARLASDTIDVQLAQNESSLARAEASIAQAQSAIEQSEASQVEAAAQLERTKSLQARGVASQDLLDQRLSLARVADARLAGAKHSLTFAEADRNLIQAQRRELELRLGKTVIKAPSDGLVLARSAKIGQVVGGAGEPLFRIARDSKIELNAELAEATLQQVTVGQPVAVTLAGVADTIRGEVRLVSPEIDSSTRLGHVRVALPVDPRLRAGSFGRGQIEIGRRVAVAVPLSAVIAEKGGLGLQVVKDGIVETRKVETGLKDGPRIEIRSGLAEAETVILKAGTFVRNGDRVSPVVAKVGEIDG